MIINKCSLFRFQNRRAKDRKQKKKGDVSGNMTTSTGQTILSQTLNMNNQSGPNLSSMLDVKPKIEPSLQHLHQIHQMNAMGMGQMGLYPHHLPPPMPPSSINQVSNPQHQLFSGK